jgi:hypothetical protein
MATAIAHWAGQRGAQGSPDTLLAAGVEMMVDDLLQTKPARAVELLVALSGRSNAVREDDHDSQCVTLEPGESPISGDDVARMSPYVIQGESTPVMAGDVDAGPMDGKCSGPMYGVGGGVMVPYIDPQMSLDF